MKAVVIAALVIASTAAVAKEPEWLNEKTLGFDVVDDKLATVQGLRESPRNALLVVRSLGGASLGTAIDVVDGSRKPTETVEAWKAMLDSKNVGEELKVGIRPLKDGRRTPFTIVTMKVTTRGEAIRKMVPVRSDPTTGFQSLSVRRPQSPLSLQIVVQKETGRKLPFVRYYYSGKDWVFVERLYVADGEERGSMDVSGGRPSRDADGPGVTESDLVPATPDTYKFLTIASRRNVPVPTTVVIKESIPRKSVTLRFSGKEISDKELTTEDMADLSLMMDAFEAHGGEWPAAD